MKELQEKGRKMRIKSVIVHDRLLEVFAEESDNKMFHTTMTFETLMQLIQLAEKYNEWIDNQKYEMA